MIYISHNQFIQLQTNYRVKEIKNLMEDQYALNLYEQYHFSLIHAVYSSQELLGFAMTFHKNNLTLYALKILNPVFKNIIDYFADGHSAILNDYELNQLLNPSISFGVFDEKIYELILWCKRKLLINNRIQCSDFCCINIWNDYIIPDEIIKEYLTSFALQNSEKVFNLYSSDNEIQFRKIQKVYNSILYFYQARIIGKPIVISEGNGYVFFQTNNFIIGKNKFFNYLESSLTYYIIEPLNKVIYIFTLEDSANQALRAGQALLAYSNAVLGGLNLHASALVYNNHTIMLTGDKGSGKTTNILFGLKSDKNTYFMSNDIVHLYNSGSKIMALGSCRKITIRPQTVELFEELNNNSICLNKYDSIGGNNSTNIQLVRTINDIALLFNRSPRFLAQADILVDIKYEKKSNFLFDELHGDDAKNVILKNAMTSYNGREKFWNDILIEKKQNHFLDFQKLRVFNVVINGTNNYKLWDIILKICH